MRHHSLSIAFTHVALTLVAGLTACTVANPTHRPRETSDASSDGPPSDAVPGTTIRVSVTGDDSADGTSAPVKTLRRAFDLAINNVAIKTISLSAGKYDLANGEEFPYAVPPGISVVGDIGDPGVVFAGTATETGIVLDTGALENIRLEDFRIAILVTGAAQLANITVKTSPSGVVASGVAKLSATGLTFAGDSSCHGLGLVAGDTAQVTVDKLVSKDIYGIAGFDQSSVAVSNANLTNSKICQSSGLTEAFGKSFVLTDSVLSGGAYGILLNGPSGSQVALVNTIIAETVNDGIVGATDVFDMTNGEIRDTIYEFGDGARLSGGTFTFTNVNITGHGKSGISISGQSAPSILKMRGCSLTGNGYYGIDLGDRVSVDLGTASSPGNNTIRDNARLGLFFPYSGNFVSAVGNTWMPGIQGSDAQGKYGPQSYTGNLPASEKANIGGGTPQF